LPLVGAEPVDARVVRDGSLFSGGGVTAGIDFALALAAEITGPEVAQAIQLALEYDPAPPFHAGSPAGPPAAIRRQVEARYSSRQEQFAQALREAAAKA
jgi:transcriptional regulator GlxA family with amidase domain